MSLIKFEHIGIKSLCAAVPSQVVKTIEQTAFFDEKKLQAFISTTGIEERRIAPENICSSDLCFHAAEKLFENSDVKKDDIEAVIFVSQTPDYREPATSILLQDRLGLRKDIYSLDINQACSGYIWGLVSAYSLCNSGFDNILLLVGDTPSKISSPKDSSTTLIFGDGGTASLINKNDKYGASYFSLNTDGSEFHAVNVPGGGFRSMSSVETLTYKKDEEGNEKNEEQLHMDGMEVFSYSVSALVKDVKKILSFSKTKLSDIDTIVLHQANKYMNDLISKKLKLDSSKSLLSIHKYGNTSCSSIPLTMADNKEKIEKNDKLLFTAIGAGFTWGSAVVQLADFKNSGLLEI